MVRFSIISIAKRNRKIRKFTFHYGQIFNREKTIKNYEQFAIYIPLWLDFQYKNKEARELRKHDLHSTMVRFSINYLRK